MSGLLADPGVGGIITYYPKPASRTCAHQSIASDPIANKDSPTKDEVMSHPNISEKKSEQNSANVCIKNAGTNSNVESDVSECNESNDKKRTIETFRTMHQENEKISTKDEQETCDSDTSRDKKTGFSSAQPFQFIMVNFGSADRHDYARGGNIKLEVILSIMKVNNSYE